MKLATNTVLHNPENIRYLKTYEKLEVEPAITILREASVKPLQHSAL